MEITYDTKIKLFPLSVRQEKLHYIVENTVTNDFFEMPEVCIEAISMIQNNGLLKDIEEKLSKKFFDEDVNIIEFIKQLIELDFVSEIDGKTITRIVKMKEGTGFQWIPQKIGQILFNRYTAKIYFAMLLGSILILIFNPELVPHYKDIFIFDLMIENVLTVFLITLLLVLLHELGHVIAIRGENLNARLELGHRLFFAVLETDLTQGWKLPAERRNTLLFAGMYIDIVVIFISLLLQLFMKADSVYAGILGIVVFNTIVRLLYQLCVFMKTDFYYILENITGCYNLMENGRNFLSRWFPIIKKDETTMPFNGEEIIVKRYAYFYLAGILLTIVITAYYYVPQMIFAVNEMMVPGFAEPLTSIRFWDSVVFLLQIVLVLGLLLYSWTKKYRISS
ncbi:hypothetical protein [Mesobacillus thioparans]|uniref:hypothetical protein n=1 Tax=Mesobacillus thioparans TaxID=370439 RepID=UPI0039EDEEF9